MDSITKRYGYLYEKIYKMENLKLAHKNAKEGKSGYKEIKEMVGYEQYYLKELQTRLKNKTYQTSNYEIFKKKEGGKERVIYKLPYFPDRIAQWAIMLIIEPILEKKLIYDTYSSIENRGIHLGVKRVGKALQDKENTKYCLKMDIKKFYPSVDHKILKNIYRKIFKDPNLLWLLDEIIDSIEGNKEIPIGNYISQWSGNIYLTYFDHWVKENLGCKNYFRYMDDMVILHRDKQHLHKVREKISGYLKKNLKLSIKGKWQVFPTRTRGLDFLGYRFFGDYRLLRKSTTKRFKNKMLKIRNKDYINHGHYTTINSYLGWLKWCNSYNLKQKYIEPLRSKIQEYERVNNIG